MSVKVNVKSFDETIEENDLLEKIVQDEKQNIIEKQFNMCLSTKNKQDDDLGKN